MNHANLLRIKIQTTSHSQPPSLLINYIVHILTSVLYDTLATQNLDIKKPERSSGLVTKTVIHELVRN